MSIQAAGSAPVRVSVVIPFLDPGPFLSEAVGSVLAQEGVALELLLVDDGSRPDENAAARSLAAMRPAQIRCLEHPGHANLGRSAARNLGLREARGEYCTFLDADDVWLPGKLAAQVELLDQHPGTPLLCSRAEWWWSWSGDPADLAKDFVQRWSVPLDAVVAPPGVLSMVLEDEWASPCDILVRTSAARALGGWEASFEGMYDDQVFHAKLCLASPVYMASMVTYRYRQHAGSCTHRAHAAGTGWWSRGRFLEWLDAYMRTAGTPHAGLRRRVRNELFLHRHPRLRRALDAARRWTASSGPAERQTVTP